MLLCEVALLRSTSQYFRAIFLIYLIPTQFFSLLWSENCRELKELDCPQMVPPPTGFGFVLTPLSLERLTFKQKNGDLPVIFVDFYTRT